MTPAAGIISAAECNGGLPETEFILPKKK